MVTKVWVKYSGLFWQMLTYQTSQLEWS